MLKKAISLFLILFLLLGLSACAIPGVQNSSESRESQPGELVIVPGTTAGKEEPVPTTAPAPETDAPVPETDAPVPETYAPVPETESAAPETESSEPTLDEDGWYNSKEEVALYIHLYGHLPGNYITKKDAEKLGWPGGSLEPYAPGKSIGGSHFGNYEGLLPDAKGRSWTECDIDTAGKSSRGAKRIVFSNDGLIYYTEDHYETFELLYGGD